MTQKIERLSNANQHHNFNASGIILVGSYAPVHEGHLDAMRSAERELLAQGESIAGNIFAPNSDSYVLKKLHDDQGVWSFSRRIGEFLGKESGTISRSYVDDITGIAPPEKSISDEVIDNVSQKLGIRACNLILVVGTDQINSIQPHLVHNRAICVLRPGSERVLQDVQIEDWYKEAICKNNLLITSRENTEVGISSTQIRSQCTRLRPYEI